MLSKILIIIVGLAFHGKMALGDEGGISERLQVVGTITQKTPTGVAGIVILKDTKSNKTKPVEIGKAFTFEKVVYRIAEINAQTVIISDGMDQVSLAYINPPKQNIPAYIADEDSESFEDDSGFDLEGDADVREGEEEATADASGVRESYRFRRATGEESEVATQVSRDQVANEDDEYEQDEEYLEDDAEYEADAEVNVETEDYEYRED